MDIQPFWKKVHYKSQIQEWECQVILEYIGVPVLLAIYCHVLDHINIPELRVTGTL